MFFSSKLDSQSAFNYSNRSIKINQIISTTYEKTTHSPPECLRLHLFPVYKSSTFRNYAVYYALGIMAVNAGATIVVTMSAT